MATAYERLKFDEAIAYFKQKIPLPTETWQQIINDAQDWAFTLSGVESALVLQTVYDKLLQILEAESETVDTFQEFADTFQQTMQAAGYGQQSPWRVALVYGQNIRTAYNAGRYRQQTDPELMAANPYLQWVHDHPLEPRPHHKALHLKVFRADHPIWKTIYPASGFGCFAKGTLVATESGWKPIESIAVGDRVIGGSGDIKPVNAVHSIPYSGEMIRVSCKGVDDTLATPNHRFLTARGWIRADSLLESDVLIQVGQLPSIDISVGKVNKIDSAADNACVTLPRERQSSKAKTFNPQTQCRDKHVNPIGVDVMIMNNLKTHRPDVVDNRSLNLRRLGDCTGVAQWVELVCAFKAGDDFCPNVRSSSRCSDPEFFSSSSPARAVLFGLASIWSPTLGGHPPHNLFADLPGLLSPLIITSPLKGDGFTASSNGYVKLLEKLHDAVISSTPAIAQLPDRHLVHNVEPVQNVSDLASLTALNSCNFAQQLNTDLTLGQTPAGNAKVAHYAENSGHGALESISDRLQRHFLLNVEEPQGFVSGAPLDRFDSLNEFLRWCATHATLTPINRLEKTLYTGTVHDLSISQDESYVIVSGIVHNCRCRVFGLSDRDLAREGLAVEEPPSQTVTIRDRITGKTQRVPAIEVDGVLYPIAEPGFTTAPGASPLEQRQQILEGALNRMSPRLRELAAQQIDFTETLDFAQLKNAGNTKQTKNCVKGWPCGFTCLSRAKKNCKRKLEGQSVSLQEWLKLNQAIGSNEFAERYAASWSNAPDDLKSVIGAQPKPKELSGTVERVAYFQSSMGGIYMNGYTPDHPQGEGVWRHEYGHHLDHELVASAIALADKQIAAKRSEMGKGTRSIQEASKLSTEFLRLQNDRASLDKVRYTSSASGYTRKVHNDSDRLVKGRAQTLELMSTGYDKLSAYAESIRRDPKQRSEFTVIDKARIGGIPINVRNGARSLADYPDDDRLYYLRGFYKDYERGQIERDRHSDADENAHAAQWGDRHFEGRDDIYAQTWQEARRMGVELTPGNTASLITADRFNDRELLVAFVDGKIASEDKMSGVTPDFIGSITLNKVGRGHSDDYYASSPDNRYTETFANFVAMYGSGKPYYNNLMNDLAPETYAAYRELIDDAARQT